MLKQPTRRSPREDLAGGATFQRRKNEGDPWHNIKDYLGQQTPAVLIDLLLDVAGRDDRLYQLLLLKAERACGGSNATEAFHRAIEGVTRVDGFIGYREVGAFADKVDQVVDSLAELLTPDSAAALVELAEYAIERVEQAVEQIDDSNGYLGGTLHRLGELHRQACEMARPDPAALAERLFRFETTLPFGVCDFDPDTYRVPLGEIGLSRYRQLAEAEWRLLKPRNPGDPYDSHAACMGRIMERLAKARGDIEELVAIKARDLSAGYCYLTIAEIWDQAGQAEKALDWAERGLRAFPERPDNRLRDFLVAAYLKRQRNDEALQLTWIQFAEQASLDHYRKLHDVAAKLGVWPQQRERALTRVGEEIARAAGATNRWQPKPSTPNTSLRVRIALWEHDWDAAWSAAQGGTCDRSLLVALAGELEASRPEEAITLYRRVIPDIVAQGNNAAYDEAAKLIRRIGGVMKILQRRSQFGDYLAELRVAFKPKRNFVKLLDEAARQHAASH